MGDRGFIGECPLVTPRRGGENNDFLFCYIINRDIRHQCISDEWDKGAIRNKWRLFYGNGQCSMNFTPSAISHAQ